MPFVLFLAKRYFIMKKLLFALTVIFASVNVNAYALSASDFDKQDEFKTTEFEMLASMEEAVEASSSEVTYAQLVQERPEFASMNLAASSSAFSLDSMDWKSFAWGFCCCPVGFFVVVLNDDKDSDQKLSYWIGVAVNVVLSAISNGVAYASL
jgi:hypothetical protein